MNESNESEVISMKKKIMAMLAAISMMTAAVPAMAMPVSAAYGGNFCVISIDYAEDGATAESYLLLDYHGWDKSSVYKVTAEEMELYLDEESAEPQVGDIVDVAVELGHFGDKGDTSYFEYSETSSFTVIGTMEELYPERMDYVVVRIYEPTGELVLISKETGDRVFYSPIVLNGYESPYTLDDPEVGDTLSFVLNPKYEYDRPYVPLSHTKGDGTIPELPETVVHTGYVTVPVIVIGPGLALCDGSEVHGFDEYSMFHYGETTETPECGDVLMVDINSIAETSPAQLCIPQNGRIVNAGSAADLYGTKTYTVTENNGYCLDLTDADGNAAGFSYFVTRHGWEIYNSEVLEAQEGERVTFMLDEEGRPAVPVSIEADVLPANEYVVVAVCETGDVVLKDASGIYTYYLQHDAVTANGKALRYGDVVQIEGWKMTTAMETTNSLQFWLDEAFTSSGCRITQTGSIFAKQLESTYTVTAIDSDLAVLQLTASDGEQVTYRMDYMLSGRGYEQMDMDWTGVQVGDQISMVTYHGLPCVPTPEHPYGDINTDGTLSIADVLALNRNLLAGDPLPALQNARSTELGYLDFDGDGTLTQADVLGMLKRVLGIG